MDFQVGSKGDESARYFLHAPAINNLDLSISKSFSMGKGIKLEVRLDAFNALNHTNFGNPATAIGMLTSSFFQGVGKGLYSLAVTITRTLLIVIPLAALLGISLGMGMRGVYLGFVTAGWASSLLALIWAGAFVRSLARRGS